MICRQLLVQFHPVISCWLGFLMQEWVVVESHLVCGCIDTDNWYIQLVPSTIRVTKLELQMSGRNSWTNHCPHFPASCHLPVITGSKQMATPSPHYEVSLDLGRSWPECNTVNPSTSYTSLQNHFVSLTHVIPILKRFNSCTRKQIFLSKATEADQTVAVLTLPSASTRLQTFQHPIRNKDFRWWKPPGCTRLRIAIPQSVEQTTPSANWDKHWGLATPLQCTLYGVQVATDKSDRKPCERLP